MEVVNLVSLGIIAVCVMVVATEDSSCFLEESHPAECKCSKAKLLCSKQRESEPSFINISRDVRELTITGYKIKELNTTRLLGKSLTNLTKLDLSNNEISTVSSDSFSGKEFPVLKSVILGNNNITFRHSDESPRIRAFHNLSSLTELDLNNSLQRDFISSDNFIDLLDQSSFVLKKLILSENKMSSLSPRLFTLNSTRNLEELYLSGNSLRTIDYITLNRNSLPNLTLLDLSRNSLDVINNQTVDNLKTFNKTRMYLGGNPFECICKSIKFVNWIKDTSLVEDRDTLLCHDLGNTPVLEIKSNQIKCPNISNAFTRSQFIMLCVIFAIVGLLALIILFMRRMDIVRFCMQVRQATKEAFDSHQTHYTYSDIQNVRRETADSGVASVDV